MKTNEKDEKDEQKLKIYTIRFSANDLARYHKAAKNRPLSILIRELLESYIRDPSILNPTETSSKAGISKDTEKKIDDVVSLLIRREQRDQDAAEDRKTIQRLSVADLKQGGMEIQDIHALLEGLNQSGKAIFKTVSKKGGDKSD